MRMKQSKRVLQESLNSILNEKDVAEHLSRMSDLELMAKYPQLFPTSRIVAAYRRGQLASRSKAQPL